MVQNAAVSWNADRLYPYLREKDVRPLPAEVLAELRRNVRAMLLHRIGAVAVFNTDNLLISKFVGVAAAGLYSNYMMIRGFLNILVSALFDAITPALGNLTATQPEEHGRTAFRRLNFFSAWLFGWMSICLFCLYDPFIDIWLGQGYLLSRPAVLLIMLNFYVNSMRIPVNNTKSVLGLFWDDRYKSILEAVLTWHSQCCWPGGGALRVFWPGRLSARWPSPSGASRWFYAAGGCEFPPGRTLPATGRIWRSPPPPEG